MQNNSTIYPIIYNIYFIINKMFLKICMIFTIFLVDNYTAIKKYVISNIFSCNYSQGCIYLIKNTENNVILKYHYYLK